MRTCERCEVVGDDHRFLKCEFCKYGPDKATCENPRNCPRCRKCDVADATEAIDWQARALAAERVIADVDRMVRQGVAIDGPYFDGGEPFCATTDGTASGPTARAAIEAWGKANPEVGG